MTGSQVRNRPVSTFVAEAIAHEMEADERVVVLGEDVGRIGRRVGANLREKCLHLRGRRLLDLIKLTGCGPGGGEHAPGDQQRVAAGEVLVLLPVGLGVALVVAAEPRAGRFEDCGAPGLASGADKLTEGGADGLCVGTVDCHARAAIRLGTPSQRP